MRFRRLASKEIGLVAVFTALYVVLAFLPMFQLIGFFGKTITAATILAPIIGIILGPYLGPLSAFLGGTIGLGFSPFFSLPSLAAGFIASLCASLLYSGKRTHCAIIYLFFLLAFGFYMPIGPAWLCPQMMWFQIIGFIILVSPLQSMAIKHLTSVNAAKALYAFLITSLTSTLAGQIAGSLVFEATFWPLLIPTVEGWKATWVVLTFVYPLERVTLAVFSVLIGAPLFRVLRSANLMPSAILERKRHCLIRLFFSTGVSDFFCFPRFLGRFFALQELTTHHCWGRPRLEKTFRSRVKRNNSCSLTTAVQ